MGIFLYTVGVLVLTAGLVLFAYLDRVYRELGRVSSGRVRDHLDSFEAEIEPRFRMDRRRATPAFSLLARLWLVLVAAVTARGVIFFALGSWEAVAEMVVFLGAEVVIAMQFLPAVLIASPSATWVAPFVPIARLFVWITRPIQAVLEILVSVLHASEADEPSPADGQEAIGAIVDAATEEGIIEKDEARLIEQVVEFSDKRVRDVMTPRPDVVAIRASATLEELRSVAVNTKFSRLPVFDGSLDDIVGIVMARDMLEVPDREAAHRSVRELIRPALFVPEMKPGAELLKEMQRKNQQMAIVIDEYGSMAGVVTVEDLVEEIVGEIGEEDRRPAPDVIREAGGALVLSGSTSADKIEESFGINLSADSGRSNVSTVAGLLNEIAGHVPRTGEIIESGGLRFEVLEANQRKVLRVRVRSAAAGAAASGRTI